VELADSFDTLAANTDLGNHAVRQLIWDASARTREALRRARARLEDAGDE
jgi:hypothetical protein